MGAVPREAAARIERDAHHLRRQPVESLLAILDEIDMLDVGGEVLAPRALDQRKDRLPSARAWVNSAKHHLLSNQLAVRTRMTASEPAISR